MRGDQESYKKKSERLFPDRERKSKFGYFRAKRKVVGRGDWIEMVFDVFETSFDGVEGYFLTSKFVKSVLLTPAFKAARFVFLKDLFFFFFHAQRKTGTVVETEKEKKEK